MKVGQLIYFEPQGNASRYNKDIKTCTISKIGRKYFEVKEIRNARFFIETLKHDGGEYCSNYSGYLSLKEIQDKKEAHKLNEEISRYFTLNSTRVSLEKMRKIKQILDN
ncbi:hypothetical protein Phi19:2_gp013 [Cellulophaga phage phi19:2]|uniref:Uncharacterized protein n=3 Tax=Cellulophaga phage phiST TaxID=756282 RepID=M4SPW4_9CAUD|nr:hypothetical protein CGPG_00093 [Cellulophaga phage phiST]AGH56791.1 hypothetical protein CGPG_00093 [Cellulophaga phage phiST]AGO47152.1 hypothetical protein PhiST_gp013 [Cellulophaga phage phiST]AGO48648.1 hypothetical protein Phi19:2_gp013 [Cellulophaga phage phi19:2]AGO49018.1 hypothetical protein Phi13:1_gp007 [Cellulophaga phage phi13:1]